MHILLIAAAAFLCSCNPDATRTAFSESDAIRLQVGRSDQFVYDPLTCQLAFNRSTGEFRAHTDNMSDYFAAVLSEIPTSVGQMLLADLTWTTHDNVLTRKNLTLEVIRLEGDKVWLWSQSGQIGLTVRILE